VTSGATKEEANGQLPISFGDLPIVIFIHKLLPIENIEIMYTNEFSWFDFGV
jgi:hypothetical protein